MPAGHLHLAIPQVSSTQYVSNTTQYLPPNLLLLLHVNGPTITTHWVIVLGLVNKPDSSWTSSSFSASIPKPPARSAHVSTQMSIYLLGLTLFIYYGTNRSYHHLSLG